MRRRMGGQGKFARSVSLAMAAGLLGVGVASAGSIAVATSAFAAQTAPAWNSYYFGVIQNVSFCYDISVTGAGSMLPLTGMTAGSTPSGMTNYGLENVNLTTGTAQICGKDTNAASTTHVTIAPVATNGGGSSTLSATTADYGKCTWTASGATTTVEDANQDLDLTGSQASFGSAITGGATAGSSSLYTSCTDAYVPSPGAFTTNQANPLPTPTDTNPSANQGDLASSNLELNNGCFGAVEILGSSSYSFGSATAKTLPSPWVNGGDCAYGSLGSNSAGGNTDTFATCPPTQYDVNIGYVDCSDTASSGTTSTSFNFSTDDVLFNGQPVPQQSTATLSAANATPGSTVTVTGGTNWWGSSGGAPNAGPYGDDQGGQMYQVSAPGVFIGTTRASAVPVTASTVTVSANTYSCTGAESTSVGPNPCTMTPGQPSGSFQVPSGLAAGTYNVYIDETNTTPLHGNGPNDAYQTARGTSLGTAESSTPVTIGGGTSTTTTSTTPTSSSIVLGSSNSDGATVTGSASADPTGSVEFYECGPTPSATPCTSGSWTQFDTESLSGSANPSTLTSKAFTPTATGYWCFAGVYSGDSNYSGSSDSTVDECFDVTAGLPAITKFSPASGAPGTVVTITGTNLSGATKVKIGGAVATITSNTATKVKVKVPSGAKTGKIKVTVPSGTAKSATNFDVT